MNLAIEARRLADYIQELKLSPEEQTRNGYSYTHIGALFTDLILQAGLNYKTVVQPRVQRVLLNYPNASTVSRFYDVINNEGIETVIKWRHPDKIRRMHDLLDFSKSKRVETCSDLTIYLSETSNREDFLRIKGIGNKTLDYTLKLLNFDTIAVDRHIYTFIELAGLPVIDYLTTKKIVEFAADILEVSRSSMDYCIWNYMSSKANLNRNLQTSINF